MTILCHCELPGEKILLKFCRYLLGVHRHTANDATHGELGQFPLLITILPLATKYWLNVCNSDVDSLVRKAYLSCCTAQSENWTAHLKQMLQIFNLWGIWDNQGFNLKHKTAKLVRSSLESHYESSWLSHINGGTLGNSSPKLRTYKLFKSKFIMEKYLLFNNVPFSKRQEFTKLRVSAHKLRIETDRYIRPKIQPEARLCKLCAACVVEDETHFILHCQSYSSERQELFKNLESFCCINDLDDNNKFIYLMTCDDYEISKMVVNFVNTAITLRKHKLSVTMQPIPAI